jgi:cytochrome c oxidase cbb3-type subunit 4
MDINDFRTLSTVLVFLAILGVAWWAYGPSRKQYFDDAAQLPFQDDNTVPARAKTNTHKENRHE